MSESTLVELVERLPEIYQPLYGHPELSDNPSRACEDRLVHLGALHDALRDKLGRPVRVLDFGCAQGYISLSLAARGAEVLGIDHLDANVQVCRKLASEHPALSSRFEHGQIEDRIATLAQDEFDLVLGLSVFHHICHALGRDATERLLTNLAEHVAVAVYELALAQEPLYWASSLPTDERALLSGYAFVHELARFSTHLSQLSRPLCVASSRYWYLGGLLHDFQWATGDSHALAHGTHRGSRQYLFGGDKLAKIVRLNGERGSYNRHELTREVAALRNIPATLVDRWPSIDGHHIGEREGWVVRDMLEGTLLLDVIMARGEYDPLRVVKDILDQLVALEREGLFHNDVRVWNVLLTNPGNAVLLDYGAIGRDAVDCVWPDDLFLAFLIFAHDVVYREVGPVIPTLAPYISPYSFPEPYATWFSKMWSLPREQWSFNMLLEICRDGGFDAIELSAVTGLSGSELWVAAMERQSSALGSYITQQDLAINSQREVSLDLSVRVAAQSALDAELARAQRQLEGQLEALNAAFSALDGRQAQAMDLLDSAQRQLADRHGTLDVAVAALDQRHAQVLDAFGVAQRQLADRHGALDVAVAALDQRHAQALDAFGVAQRQLADRHGALDVAVAALDKRHAEAMEIVRSAHHQLEDRHVALDEAVASLEQRHGYALGDLRDQVMQALNARLLDTERTLMNLVSSFGAIEGRLDEQDKQLTADLAQARRAWEPVIERIELSEGRTAQTAEKLEHLHDASMRTAADVDKLQCALDEALRDLDRTRQQLMASEAARQDMQQQIEIIYSSRSFQWTRPLRYLSSRLRSCLPAISGVLRPGWHRLVRHAWGRWLGLAVFYPFPSLRARIYASIAAHAKIRNQPRAAPSERALSPAAADIHKRLQQLVGEKPRKKV